MGAEQLNGAQTKPWDAFNIEPHAWYGLAADGGSNELCRRVGCGEFRLAKVHMGFAPELIYPETLVQHEGQDMFMQLSSEEANLIERIRKGEWTVVPVREERVRKLPDPNRTPAEVAWADYVARVGGVLRDKRAYGDAWREQGYMGNLARVLSKTSRLRNMEWGDWAPGRESKHEAEESVLDTLLDLGPLVAFLISNLEDGNRWGNG